MSTNTQELDKQLVEMIDEYFPKDKRHARGQAILMIPAIKALIESAIQEARKETETRVIDEIIEAAPTKPFKNWGTMDILKFFDVVGQMYRAPHDSLTNSEPTNKEEAS